jgi:hypothetical protein
MLRQLSVMLVLPLSAVSILPAPARAVVDLQITEIWPGGLAGAENTSDWFEITNFGDMAATNLLASPLHMDDDSAAFASSVELEGIDTIGPGESVIYLTDYEGGFGDLAGGTAAFLAMWGPLPGVQIGGAPGSIGLGGGGDAVNIWDDFATLLDSEGYSTAAALPSFVSNPDGTWVDNTFAQVDVWGAYEGNFGATSSISDPPIGSPGTTGAIPEPSTMLLLLLGAVAAAFCGRRRGFKTSRLPFMTPQL